MKLMYVLGRLCIGAAVFVAAAVPFAFSQAPYPAQPIRIVCPFPAGGGTDLTARLLAEHLQKLLGQTVIVENRTGASGMIGTAAVAKAPPKPSPRHKPDEGQSPTMNNKKATQRHGFKTNEFIVYPAHGVGQIVAIEEQEVAGMKLELFVINFVKDKMTLRVPIAKVSSVGMRKLAEGPLVKRALDTLKGRARIKRTMWSRRAQEYETKINSGDIVAIAEVVRDLYRSDTQPEQSYSERQLYEDALDRMAREIAAVEKLDERGAVQRITDVLSKSARGRRLAAEAEGGDAETRAA